MEPLAFDAMTARSCMSLRQSADGGKGHQGGREDDMMEWPWAPSALLPKRQAQAVRCPHHIEPTTLQWLTARYPRLSPRRTPGQSSDTLV